MKDEFGGFRSAEASIFEWLKKEYSSIRTNLATPSILDGVLVEAYSSKLPINQVASVVASGPKSLLITPWDKDVAPAIDRAIRESNLGLSAALDSQGVRIFFPELTSERRELLIKALKEKFEEARIKIRLEREKVLNDLERRMTDGSLSKDDKFRLKNELQKLVDDANQKLEGLTNNKEREINQ